MIMNCALFCIVNTTLNSPVISYRKHDFELYIILNFVIENSHDRAILDVKKDNSYLLNNINI